MKNVRILVKVKKFFCLITSLFLFISLSLAQDIRWQVDNTVYSSLMVGNTLYIGGSFSYVGKYTGTAVIIPEASGNMPDASALKINVSSLLPSISSIIPDGQGGYFVAGTMSYVDGGPSSPSCHVVYIKKDPAGFRYVVWAARTNGSVNCLYLLGSTLYMGGAFSSVISSNGTFTRRDIVAFNTADGSITSWDPGFAAASTAVFSIAGAGSVVYAGGKFTYGSFSNLAAINTGTATAAWVTPNNPNNTVRAVTVWGSRLYVGGDFNAGGTLARLGLAALNTSDGTTIASFNAGATAPAGTNALRTLAVSSDGNTLYAGGAFFGFQSRNYLIALNTSTALVTSWNPNPSNFVNTVALSGNESKLYVGGTFNSIGGQSRNFISAISTTTGLDDNSWVTLTNGIVNYISVQGGNIFMGGEFTSVGGANRNRVAAIDYTNNTLLPWNPNANNIVRALVNYRGAIYAGGDFDNIGGLAKGKIAALDPVSGAVITSWSADANATVRALYGYAGSIYVGGDFTTIGGQSRNRIAKLNFTTGAVSTWNAGADNIVRTIAAWQQKIYAGGDFDNIGGQARSKIAALDSTTGNALASWYPTGGAVGTTSAVPCRVNTIAVSQGRVYAGGSFATMGGLSKKNVVAIDNNGAILNGFTANPNSANEVNFILPSGLYLYVGGSFNDMKTNLQHKHLSEIDTATGNPSLSFYASPGAQVNTVAVNGALMYFGGAFPNYIPDFGSPVARNSFLSYRTANGGFIIVPINIRNFSVQQQNNARVIKWTAENETAGSTMYEVQRAGNDRTFSTIISQPAINSIRGGNYEVQDRNLLNPGLYYYRLKITQQNSVSYSSVQSVAINTNEYIVRFSNGRLSVTSPSGNSIFYLSNSAGQVVAKLNVREGLNNFLLNNLSKGVYVYRIDNKSKIITGKIALAF